MENAWPAPPARHAHIAVEVATSPSGPAQMSYLGRNIIECVGTSAHKSACSSQHSCVIAPSTPISRGETALPSPLQCCILALCFSLAWYIIVTSTTQFLKQNYLQCHSPFSLSVETRAHLTAVAHHFICSYAHETFSYWHSHSPQRPVSSGLVTSPLFGL